MKVKMTDEQASVLIGYIKNQNEQTKKWVAQDPKNRFAGLLCEDIEHWEEYGIATIEQLESYLNAEAEAANQVYRDFEDSKGGYWY